MREPHPVLTGAGVPSGSSATAARSAASVPADGYGAELRPIRDLDAVIGKQEIELGADHFEDEPCGSVVLRRLEADAGHASEKRFATVLVDDVDVAIGDRRKVAADERIA